MTQQLTKVNQEGKIDIKMSDSHVLVPTNLSEGIRFAELIANSDLAPKDYRGKPANAFIAMQMGAEIGLAPMQAIQNIAVINGRGCIWGDALPALVQSSGKCEWIKEWYDNGVAYCTTKRKGYPEPYTTTFSMDDAKAAGLVNKDGSWRNYPKRMLQMRARAFNLRDQFADVLKGLSVAEEVMDYEVLSPATESMPEVLSMTPKRKSEQVAAPAPKPEVVEAQQPKAAPEPVQTQTEKNENEQAGEAVISESQVRRLYAICGQNKISGGDLKAYLAKNFKIDSAKEILKQDYEGVCKWAESQGEGREPGEEG